LVSRAPATSRMIHIQRRVFKGVYLDQWCRLNPYSHTVKGALLVSRLTNARRRVSIGDKVRATRKAVGISQEEVARRAGVSLNVINRLERGVILDPHYSTLRGIARALRVPVEDLVREPALAGKAEAEEPLISRPEVREWLSEQGHETLEEFRSMVEELETLENVEQAIRELREKRDGLVDKLGDRSVQVKLFGPVCLEGLVGDERLREVFWSTEHARKIKREIRREYDAREDALAEYSRVLFEGGKADDYVVREPVGDRDRERHERLLEARRVLEETYAALSAA
jgi:transcriptional regulator with XRE-family HTH domain